MGICDMCGKEAQLFLADIESTKMNVCRGCGSFGRIIRKAAPIPAAAAEKKKPEEPSPDIEEPEIMEMIVEDYAAKIRNKRESMGMKQEDFAKLIKEKVSVLQNIEKGKLDPSIKLAKKLENILKITLIEEVEDRKPLKINKKEEDQEFTIADFIRKK